MKRNLMFSVLVAFVFASVFCLSSCAKKQVVEEEKEVKAPPKKEAEAEGKKELAEREKEFEKKEEKAWERLQRLEEAEEREKAAEAEEEEQLRYERRAVQFEAKSVYFDFDKSFIRHEYRPILRGKAAFMKENPDIRVRIEGNCDERGTNEYNLALGERRANSAKEFLTTLGISPDRIDTISYGEERPIALGHNEKAWAQNRRDDFVVIE